jgi:flagellar motor protein MotB
MPVARSIRSCALLSVLAAGAARAEPRRSPLPPGTCDCTQANNEKTAAIETVLREQQEQLARLEDLSKSIDSLKTDLEKSLELPDEPTVREQVSVAATDGRIRVRLASELLFNPASARITRAGRRALTELAGVLGKKAVGRIEVAGHTDDLAPGRKYEDNWQLSCERARRVVALLIAGGVAAHHLVAAGYADASPVATGQTPEVRAANRRVDIWIEPAAPK